MMLTVALFLHGCMGPLPISLPNPDFALNLAQPAPTPAPSPTPSPIRAAYGGHLYIAMPLPVTLNPLLNSDPDVDTVLRLIFEPLVIFDYEQHPIPNPAITQSIVFSADGNTLAVTLRDNIFWEDGSPITSDDIAFSIDVLRFSAPATAIYRSNVANIASHMALDGRTLQINLHSPMWAMKYMLAFPIIPADYYRPVSMTNLRAARNMHPLGNGPFRFFEHELASHLKLMANEDAPGGRPYIGTIMAIFLRDMDGAGYAFERGLTHVLLAGAEDWGRFGAMGKTRAAEILTNDFDFIGFNFRNPLFADYETRAAIAASDFVLAEDVEISIIVNAANVKGVSMANSLTFAAVEALPFDAFISRVNAGDFDIVVGGIATGPAPNFDFLYNILGYSSEELDLLLSMKRHAPSDTAFHQAMADIRQYITDNLLLIDLGFRRQVLYTAGHVHGDIRISPNSIFENIRDWHLSSP